ncbi:MAG: response regulator transcription factor [Chloroflexi bacterium]|nr:response regulator transcription factor [Chloroflexota bacterium]
MTTNIAIAERIVTVVVVDDQETIRQGIKASLTQDRNIRVIGEAASSKEAISLIGQLKPDVAVVDIRLGEGSGIDVSKAVKTISPTTKILVVSAYDYGQYVSVLVKLGVSGYLMKTGSVHELIRAVHDAAEGWLVFAPPIAPKVLDLLTFQEGAHPQPTLGDRNLTVREAEVLQRVADGRKNTEIATDMHIAVKTVEAHIENVLIKLGAKNRTGAVVAAMNRGWLSV